ncbi:MAG: hypothetical protein J0H73_05460 [Salana multivorans]|uniref:hypothetical protein n=1 Tax=Salana multivorans TaxID=120377 RepID=UPI000966B230|nr:hypothetical protein [Salana multivorans]MBN8881746.1 hypothetical protein [Salana multivorans]OJX98244.1 MAG: hypothetical protein BGO96_03345 [Micrococcales bacterium 73-15]
MTTIRWDTPAETDAAWGWLEPLLGEFGTVGCLVPAGFEAHVSVPNSRDPENNGCSLVQTHDDARPDGRDQLDRLLAVLGLTGPGTDRVLHCAIWEGFGGMFREPDGTVGGASLGISFGAGDELTPQQLEAERRRIEAEWAASKPPRPPATTLHLPHRDHYTWTTTAGRLRADVGTLDGFSPTIVFPADPAGGSGPAAGGWLWHSEIDGRRTEIGGPAALLAPLLTPEWGGIAVERADLLGEIPGWPA